MEQKQLVIFDLDGTLLDTLPDLHGALIETLAAFGLPPRTMEETRRFVGNGIRRLVERAVPDETPLQTVDAAYHYYLSYYMGHCAEKTAPYPGVTDLLRALRKAGKKMAIVSNKADAAVQSLCETYFRGLYDAAVGERAGVARKPAPDSVNAVLAALGAARVDAVYVGDSEVDIATAKNAGLPCISVTWGFRDRETLVRFGASVFADNAEELARLLIRQ